MAKAKEILFWTLLFSN